MILNKEILYLRSHDTPFGLLRDPSGRPLFLLCVFPVEVWKQKILGVKIILFFFAKELEFFFF